ncbi:fluoride efflux transporter CrcB [Aneurinibacillus sp. REN35]|uniref:fluoride efflux transporter CrcB n=1 Tax=Aneurinibacillus sp. REN35 TaxID=3237286 RepID=UPI003527CF93
MVIVWVALGGFFGAISRYAAVQWIDRRMHSAFPYGTMTVNLLGSFLLGLLYGWDVDRQLTLLLGAGFLGSFTTFSTFAYETVQLQEKGKRKEIVVYISISVLLGILAAALGLWIALMVIVAAS